MICLDFLPLCCNRPSCLQPDCNSTSHNLVAGAFCQASAVSDLFSIGATCACMFGNACAEDAGLTAAEIGGSSKHQHPIAEYNPLAESPKRGALQNLRQVFSSRALALSPNRQSNAGPNRRQQPSCPLNSRRAGWPVVLASSKGKAPHRGSAGLGFLSLDTGPGERALR